MVEAHPVLVGSYHSRRLCPINPPDGVSSDNRPHVASPDAANIHCATHAPTEWLPRSWEDKNFRGTCSGANWLSSLLSVWRRLTRTGSGSLGRVEGEAVLRCPYWGACWCVLLRYAS